jgi:arsenical pump membrane protein
LTIAALVLGHGRARPRYVMAASVAVGLATGVIAPGSVAPALRPLLAPLAFLVFAVPLALSLDRLGFFAAAARRVTAQRRLRPSLWVFAAGVTTVFNLDTAIVLLTPLYLRIARRYGLDPLTTALQPVLLASLASSMLPVSNLTNLIVVETTGARAGAFLLRLGPASVAAVAVGWWVFRRTELRHRPAVVTSEAATSGLALRIGVPVVIFLVVGFTVGAEAGIPAWLVSAVALAAVTAFTRHVPWRAVPVDAITVAAGLAVLAGAVAEGLSLSPLLSQQGTRGSILAFAAGVAGANLVNNLPALLVGLPFVTDQTLWPFLAAVNFGPVLWLHGSLAGLLWLDIVRAHGLVVTPLSYARVGIRVGIPALAAAGLMVLLVGAIAPI